MTKTFKIKKIESHVNDPALVSQVLDKAGIGFERIDTVNWQEFPYKPQVSFRAAHIGDKLLINYRCSEEAVRAAAEADNGPVWEDSCVEFFVTFDDKKYYNIECNCMGTILCATGKDRNNRTQAPYDILTGVKRYASLAGKIPSEGTGDISWEVSLIIPVTTYFGSGIKSFDSIKARGNFYKCGDKLPTPHFLSWNPISTDNPDFHRPEFFGQVIFE